MPSEPILSADALLEQLRGRFEKLCQDVADAVNQAPAGQVINASEEKVRDLLADFRQATYQAAVQLRTDAAQAAFPPSAAPADGNASAE
jgi:Rod binding domain-containing protein